MSQIIKKLIGDNQVGHAKIRLENNQTIKARNFADSADIGLIKLNASDELEAILPMLVPTPTAANHAAPKTYVDSALSALFNGLLYKSPVKAASTGNLTLSAPQTVDGIALIAGDRVLAKNQTLPEENGIYVVAAGAWSRAADFDAAGEIKAMSMIPVSEGTDNGDTVWFVSSGDVVTLGVDSIVLSKLGPATPAVLPSWNKPTAYTLAGGDITNQYVDMPHESLPGSLSMYFNGLTMIEGVDYTLSVVLGVTRVSFQGDLATGGAAELIAGDILYFQYQH